MTRTARYLGTYALGCSVALMQPSPWRSLWHYVRHAALGKAGRQAFRILCQQSTQDANMRRLNEQMADHEAREALKPKPSRIITPGNRIWPGNGRPR